MYDRELLFYNNKLVLILDSNSLASIPLLH